jgi:hypothetical protein
LTFGGIEHVVEVSANSLYEAVAQALRIFRDNDWIEGQLRYLRMSTHPSPNNTSRILRR